MGWVPAVRVEVVKIALPEELRVAVPRTVLPSRKVTGPVGTAKFPLMVAVRLTDWPVGAGLRGGGGVAGGGAGGAVVGSGRTVTMTMLEVELEWMVSPE